MQHDNGFCTGCHIMKPSYVEFVGFEDKHDLLNCHACHQQGMSANLRQLYLWVAERPEEIGEHARVPDRVCKSCHGVGDPRDSTWMRIAGTAGHRVHLESDSTALRDVMCVTCHGVEVHRFVPANRTCAQQGCHEESQTEIVLGRMSGQSFQHCTQCHQFTTDVPALATRDSAVRTLSPSRPQCFSCHQMESVLTDYDLARDPHSGQCGLCHNPHTQAVTAEAVKTCASAQCHSDWRSVPFHTGPAHRASGHQCLTCHQPHAAKVDASNCEGCHVEVRARTGRRPPLPFDTSAALRRTAAIPHPDPPITFSPPRAGDDGSPPRGKGDAPPEDDHPSGVRFPGWGRTVTRTAQDSFPHSRHRSLACVTCHRSTTGHGTLVFEAPRGCMICHHQARQQSPCAACHRPAELQPVAHPVAVTLTVARQPPRQRTVTFTHDRHREVPCTECHTTPVTLALSAAARECRDCHELHHEPARDCSTCHAFPDIRRAHEVALGGRENASHQQCDACHTPATVGLLEPNRSFCATCHAEQKTGHHADRQCTVCHLLSEPGEWRPRLSGGRPE
jgi:hypothetical protein